MLASYNFNHIYMTACVLYQLQDTHKSQLTQASHACTLLASIAIYA